MLFTNPKGILLLVFAGICALGIDYFALKAYSSGSPISIIGPIIIAGSIALAAFIGFFLGESVHVMKIVGLILVLIGAGILSAFGG